MRIYASDLTVWDKIVPKGTDREVIIQWLDQDGIGGDVTIEGYFEDNGQDYFRKVPADSQIRLGIRTNEGV